MEVERGRFYIGARVENRERQEPLLYTGDDLVTHGVIVGMTGSGKTGLGIDVLEEALLAGIPCLIIDPKGDMGNLRLVFPELAADDFAPWVDEAEAEREGITVEQLAEKTAATWKEGLADWDIDEARLRGLVDSTTIPIYTPGSTAGIPLNVLGSLSAPDLAWDDHAEVIRDEIEGFVSSLLALIGVNADPISSPPHILLATIVEHEWRAGRDLDLAGLVALVPEPPFRTLGIFQLDEFYPRRDRDALARQLNGLLASPSFATWLEGPPLDLERMLAGNGTTQAAVVHIAHLSDAERQFVVTLLLAKLVTWMRRQPGTGRLRALVYLDEVFGFAPPVAEPPAKKQILTILKQARAYGVGMLLATQNPVDLDYKAMSNAGTWMIGRLQTENDKKRVLEGLADAGGSTDVAAVDTLVSNLDKRQFVLRQAGDPTPTVFSTRWAMSYLAGPLDRNQIIALTAETPPEAIPVAPAAETAPKPESVPPADTVPMMPRVADGVAVARLDPAAAWAAQVGAVPQPSHLRPIGVATVDLLYDDRYADVDHREQYEVVIDPLPTSFDPATLIAVDHDERDFEPVGSSDGPYLVPDAPIGDKTYWKSLGDGLVAHLVAERKLAIWKNASLKLYSRVGETLDEFRSRCAEAAEAASDADIAKLKDRYAKRIDTVRKQISRADRRVVELQADVESRRQQEMISGVGDLVGSLISGRSKSAALRRAASRRSQTQRTSADLQSALDRLSHEERELVELEAELAGDVAEIVDGWTAKTEEIAEVEIPLEKSDVKVADLKLVWVPTA